MGELTYDMVLEVEGILRSQDLRVSLSRELALGETIAVHGREWVVTEVGAAKPQEGLDRRLVAREVRGRP